MRVGVVGGGVAGLALATMLGRQGHDVTVFEQASEPGPVGAGLLLQPSGQAVLANLGLLEAIERDSWPIRTFRANFAPGRRLAELRYDRRDTTQVALGVGRGLLFQALWRAAEAAGARLVAGAGIAEAVAVGHIGVRLIDMAGVDRGTFDWVAAADGAWSRLRVACGLGRACKPDAHAALWGVGTLSASPAPVVHEEARGTGTLAGLLPTGPRTATVFWGLRADEREAIVAEGWPAFCERVLAVLPDAAEALDSVGGFDRMILTRYGFAWPGRMWRGRVVLLGDAAHPTSPHLAQGANLALLDAAALANAVAEVAPDQDIRSAFRRYERRRWPMDARYSLLSRILSPFFQSSRPGLGPLRDLGLPVLSWIPPFRALMERVLAGRG